MALRITCMDKVAMQTVRRCLNRAFADYLVPVEIDQEAFRAKLYGEGIDPSCSVVAMDDDGVVGILLQAVDPVDGVRTAWNGGMGVIPGYRRQGIGGRMHDAAMVLLEGSGVRRVMLEVIDRNHGAVRMYRKSGYTLSRTMWCYQGMADESVSREILDRSSGALVEMGEGAWSAYVSGRTHPPAWQNGDAKLARISEAVSVWAWIEDNELSAWVRTDRERPGMIYQVGVHPALMDNTKHSPYVSRTAITRLLAALSQRSSGMLAMLNADQRDMYLHHAFATLGLAPYLTQLEMVRPLDPAGSV